MGRWLEYAGDACRVGTTPTAPSTTEQTCLRKIRVGKDRVGEKRARNERKEDIFVRALAAAALPLVTAPVRNLRSLHFKSGQVNVPTSNPPPSGVGASVCVRTSGCRQNSAAAVSTAPRPSSPSPWTEPTSFRDPSVPSTVHPRLLRVRVTEPAPCPPCPCLSVCTGPCVLACLERVFHFGWLVARAPLSLPPPPFSVAARQAGRQAGPPSLPLARALRFGESVFQPLASAAVAAACPPTAACNGRTQTVTRWQPLSLVVSQVPLRSAIWCSESDHLTRGKEFARRRRQRDATQTQDIVLRRTRTALRTSGRG